MGAMRTVEMIEYAGYELALSDHLRHNHFPPIIAGEEFAKLAIDAVVEEEPERIVAHGDRQGEAGEVVTDWHLGPFVDVRLGEVQ